MFLGTQKIDPCKSLIKKILRQNYPKFLKLYARIYGAQRPQTMLHNQFKFTNLSFTSNSLEGMRTGLSKVIKGGPTSGRFHQHFMRSLYADTVFIPFGTVRLIFDILNQ